MALSLYFYSLSRHETGFLFSIESDLHKYISSIHNHSSPNLQKHHLTTPLSTQPTTYTSTTASIQQKEQNQIKTPSSRRIILERPVSLKNSTYLPDTFSVVWKIAIIILRHHLGNRGLWFSWKWMGDVVVGIYDHEKGETEGGYD